MRKHVSVFFILIFSSLFAFWFRQEKLPERVYKPRVLSRLNVPYTRLFLQGNRTPEKCTSSVLRACDSIRSDFLVLEEYTIELEKRLLLLEWQRDNEISSRRSYILYGFSLIEYFLVSYVIGTVVFVLALLGQILVYILHPVFRLGRFCWYVISIMGFDLLVFVAEHWKQSGAIFVVGLCFWNRNYVRNNFRFRYFRYLGKKKCILCLENFQEMAIVPCGHKCICSQCSANLIKYNHSCPVCRVKIEKTIRIFD